MADYVSPDQRRRIATGLMAAQYSENPPTAPMGYDFDAAPLSPGLMNFAAQRGQPGVIQKALGLIPGFDQDGKRGAQSWGNALMSTAQFPIDAVAGMGQAITAPARAYRGEFDPVSEEGVGEALNVAGNAMMGGLAAPKPAGNAVGIFGGRLAKTADQAALARAEELAAKGAPREQIWTETGWFKAPDGRWKWEIDDSQSQLTESYARSVAAKRMKDLGRTPNPENGFQARNAYVAMYHPHLWNAYRDLADSGVSFLRSDAPALHGGIAGNFRAHRGGPGTPAGNIAVNKDMSEQAKRSTMLHELQHGVQALEGSEMPSGKAFAAGDLATYRQMASEVEARAVQARRDLTPEQRASRFPWLDYDVPEANQIVRFGDGGLQNSIGSAGGELKGAALGAPQSLNDPALAEILRKYGLDIPSRPASPQYRPGDA